MASTQAKKTNSKPFYKSKVFIITSAIVGVLILLFIVAAIFGTPSAKSVFKDMQETMLQTKSVTIDQTYKLTTVEGDGFNLKTTAMLDMTSSKELLARGNFTLGVINQGVPIDAEADFIVIGDSKFVRFNKLSSSSSSLASSLQTAQSKLKSNWIKVRDNDNYATFANVPIEALTVVLPVPFANLNDSQRKVILDILQDDSTYTINESSKVEINDVSAYKYSLSFSENQFSKFEKGIASYVDYIKVGESNDSQVKSLNVWVNTSTKQIIKIEFTGTSKQGNIEGTILFSNYNKSSGVAKPDDYSIESELIN